MTPTYARFAATPIGPNLAARDGGLTLTTLEATGLTSLARSDVAHDAGTRGVEFAVWGDDDLAAVVGVCTASASLSGYVGADNHGLGWRLHTGQIVRNGSVLASGLPTVAKGDIVGIRVLFGTDTIEFYKAGSLVHSRALTLGSALHFAASLASTDTGTLALAVNAGQWGAVRSLAGRAGWPAPVEAAAAVRLSDLDFLTATDDSPANARYEGLLVEGLRIVETLSFWPWSESPSTTGGGAECTVLDAQHRLDGVAMADVAGAPVAIRAASRGSALSNAVPVARYALDGIRIVDDLRKRLVLRDPHDDLDRVINRGIFLPNIPALAWRAMPVVIGAVASVPALSASSDGTTRWLADGRVHVGDVMDRGDVMEDGTYTLSDDGQQLLMDSPPVGPVGCDCSSLGITSGQLQPATLQEALADVFGRIGKSAWSSADAAAIDAATGYAGIGYYSGDAVTARMALVAILNTYGAWFWRAPNGVLRFRQIIAPESWAGDAAFDLAATEMATDLVRVPDKAPNLTRRFAYRLNAQAMGASDLVTDFEAVPQARRDELSGLWRGQVYAGGAMPPRYAHADTSDPFLSLFWRAEDAQAEADRIAEIYSVERNTFEAQFKGTLKAVPKPGDIGRIKYPRYGLESGKWVQVRKVARVEGTGAVTLTLWG